MMFDILIFMCDMVMVMILGSTNNIIIGISEIEITIILG